MSSQHVNTTQYGDILWWLDDVRCPKCRCADTQALIHRAMSVPHLTEDVGHTSEPGLKSMGGDGPEWAVWEQINPYKINQHNKLKIKDDWC